MSRSFALKSGALFLVAVVAVWCVSWRTHVGTLTTRWTQEPDQDQQPLAVSVWPDSAANMRTVKGANSAAEDCIDGKLV